MEKIAFAFALLISSQLSIAEEILKTGQGRFLQVYLGGSIVQETDANDSARCLKADVSRLVEMKEFGEIQVKCAETSNVTDLPIALKISVLGTTSISRFKESGQFSEHCEQLRSAAIEANKESGLAKIGECTKDNVASNAPLSKKTTKAKGDGKFFQLILNDTAVSQIDFFSNEQCLKQQELMQLGESGWGTYCNVVSEKSSLPFYYEVVNGNGTKLQMLFKTPELCNSFHQSALNDQKKNGIKSVTDCLRQAE